MQMKLSEAIWWKIGASDMITSYQRVLHPSGIIFLNLAAFVWITCKIVLRDF